MISALGQAINLTSEMFEWPACYDVKAAQYAKAAVILVECDANRDLEG
jgi:hypothetical protein